MEQVLTSQIAAAYWSADVSCAPYVGQPKRKLNGKMCGLNSYHMDIKFPEWQASHFMLIDKCQLILKPLSAISDEDAVALVDEVVQIYGDYDREWKVNCGKCAAKTMNHPYGPLRSDYSRHLIDFLRSKGYDCGWGQIPSLIEAGIAIANQTLSKGRE